MNIAPHSASSIRHRAAGFSLIELAIGLAILALATVGMIAAMAKQAEQRKFVQTRSTLETARETSLGQGELIREALEHQMIENDRSLIGHSDADVGLHALTDALLGAAALGDIGHHFPDTDAAFKGIDSRILLRKVFADVQALGYQLGNLDVTIMAQAPKMAPHINAMREVLAADLKPELSQVNVKATTTEKLGFVGRKEGIAVEAVVLLVKSA